MSTILNNPPVIDLSASKLIPLHAHRLIVLHRAEHLTGRGMETALVALPAVNAPTAEAGSLLECEFNLRSRLDPNWALIPLSLEACGHGPALIFSDPGGVPLCNLPRGKLDMGDFLSISLALTAAIDDMHSSGMFHLNLHPSSILLASNRRIYLTGFGKAKYFTETTIGSKSTAKIVNADMTPKQRKGLGKIDGQRDDLYSLGAILYELLNGEPPFAQSASIDSTRSHVQRLSARPSRVSAKLREHLSQIIMRLLGRHSDDSYETAQSVLADFIRYRSEWRKGSRITHGKLPQSRGAHEVSSSTSDHLDLHSALQALQPMSGETVIDDLIKTLLATSLTFAGADSGMLFLNHDEKRLIAARADITSDQIEIFPSPTELSPDEAPNTLLNAVALDRKSIVLNGSAGASALFPDAYILRRSPASAVCIPLLKYTNLIGLLYLENSTEQGIFNHSRVIALELLATHAALSLDNAYLFKQLQLENDLRRKTEDALKASKVSLEIARTLTQAGGWRWNTETGEFSCCEGLIQILKFDPPPHTITFEKFLERIHCDDRPQVEKGIYEALNKEGNLQQEYRITLPDGTLRDLESVGRAEINCAGKLEIFGSVIDVSNRKRSDEALRLAQGELARVARITAMGQFAASMAHEVSQPLAAIVLNADAGLCWLRQEPAQLALVEDALNLILQAGNTAGSVIRSIRGMARKSGPELAPCMVDDAIREVLLLLRAELQSRKVGVYTQLTLGKHLLNADRAQLQQVIMNLVLNAIDAMSNIENRQRLLEVRSAIADTSGTLRISIEDNGIGIDTISAGCLFDPLFSTKPDGMGMGLAICRSIVEAHGGRVWCTSRQPYGTSFHVSFPPSCEQVEMSNNIKIFESGKKCI